METKKRDGFNSRIGALLAIIGSAVGLGNLWRFPYVVGENGGGAFIIVYLIISFGLCTPLMMTELLIGRRGKSNVVGAFKAIDSKSKFYYSGYIFVLASFLILSFYSVVGGWVLHYLGESLTFSLSNLSSEDLTLHFKNLVSAPVRPLLLHFLFMFLTASVVIFGIEKGIEKMSKIFMPILFVFIVVLAIRSLTLPGAGQGLNFLFNIDFSKITMNTVFEALGQSFFSLSLGIGCIITYGSYMRSEENIMKSSIVVVSSDILFALIAGLAIIPAVFAFNFEPAAGPGLVFIVLPQIFSQIAGGSVFQIIFFFILFIAAITSSISLLETVVAYVVEELKITRRKATIYTSIIITIVGCFCALSEGALADFKLFGLNFFSLVETLASNILLPLGSIFIAIFASWVMKKKDVVEELSNYGTIKVKNLGYYFVIVKFVAPIAISFILIKSLLF